MCSVRVRSDRSSKETKNGNGNTSEAITVGKELVGSVGKSGLPFILVGFLVSFLVLVVCYGVFIIGSVVFVVSNVDGFDLGHMKIFADFGIDSVPRGYRSGNV